MSLRPHRNIFQYFESSEPKLDDSDNDSDYVPEKRAKSKSRSNSRSVFDENEPGPSGLNQTIEPGASESGSTNRSSEILQTNGSDVDYSSDSESDDMEVNETEEFDIAVRRDPAADEEWSEDLTNFPHIPEFSGHSGLLQTQTFIYKFNSRRKTNIFHVYAYVYLILLLFYKFFRNVKLYVFY